MAGIDLTPLIPTINVALGAVLGYGGGWLNDIRKEHKEKKEGPQRERAQRRESSLEHAEAAMTALAGMRSVFYAQQPGPEAGYAFSVPSQLQQELEEATVRIASPEVRLALQAGMRGIEGASMIYREGLSEVLPFQDQRLILDTMRDVLGSYLRDDPIHEAQRLILVDFDQRLNEAVMRSINRLVAKKREAE